MVRASTSLVRRSNELVTAYSAAKQVARMMNLDVIPSSNAGLGNRKEDDVAVVRLLEALNEKLTDAILCMNLEWLIDFAKTSARAISERYLGTQKTVAFVDGNFFPVVCLRLLSLRTEDSKQWENRNREDENVAFVRSGSKRFRAEELSDERDTSEAKIRGETCRRASSSQICAETDNQTPDRRTGKWIRSVAKLALCCLGCVTPTPSTSIKLTMETRRAGSPLAVKLIELASEHGKHLCESDWLSKNLICSGAWFGVLLERGMISKLGQAFEPKHAVRLLLAVENESLAWREKARKTPSSSNIAEGTFRGWRPFSAACVAIGLIGIRLEPFRRSFLRFCAESILRAPFLWTRECDDSSSSSSSSSTQAISSGVSYRRFLDDALKQLRTAHWTQQPSCVLEILLRTLQRNRGFDVDLEDFGLLKNLAASALWTDHAELLRRMKSAYCLDSVVLDLAGKKWFFEEARVKTLQFLANDFPIDFAREALVAFDNGLLKIELEIVEEGRTEWTPTLDFLALACESQVLQNEEPRLFRKVRHLLLSALSSTGAPFATCHQRRLLERRDWFGKKKDPLPHSSQNLEGAFFEKQTENHQFLEFVALSCVRLKQNSLTNLLSESFIVDSNARAVFCARAFFSTEWMPGFGFEHLSAIFGISPCCSVPDPDAALSTISAVENLLSLGCRVWSETENRQTPRLEEDRDRTRDELWSELFSEAKKPLDAHGRPLRFAWCCSMAVSSWNWKESNHSAKEFLARVWTVAFALSMRVRPELDVSSRFGDLPLLTDLFLPENFDVWGLAHRLIPPGSEYWMSRSLAGVLDRICRDRKVNGGSLARSAGRWNPLSNVESILDLAKDPRCQMSAPVLFRLRGKKRANAESVLPVLFRALRREDPSGSYFRLILSEWGHEIHQRLEKMDDETIHTCVGIFESEILSGPWLPNKGLESRVSNEKMKFALALENELCERKLSDLRLRVWKLLGLSSKLDFYDPAIDYPYDSEPNSFPCRACLLELEDDQLVISYSCAHPVHLSCAQASATCEGSNASSCPLRCEGLIVPESIRRFRAGTQRPPLIKEE